MMVGSRRSEEVVDPNIEVRPSTRSLKRALLTALRCVDPDSEKRPRMGQVVRMLESEEYPIPREVRFRPFPLIVQEMIQSLTSTCLSNFRTEGTEEIMEGAWRSIRRGKTLTLTGVTIPVQDQRAKYILKRDHCCSMISL